MKPQRRKPPKALMIIALLIFLSGAAHSGYYLNFMARAETVTAEITGGYFLPGKSNPGRRGTSVQGRRLLFVEFSNARGELIEAELVYKGRETKSNGGTIEILYLPDNPATVRPNTRMDTWGTGAIVMLAAIAFWALSALIISRGAGHMRRPWHGLP